VTLGQIDVCLQPAPRPHCPQAVHNETNPNPNPTPNPNIECGQLQGNVDAAPAGGTPISKFKHHLKVRSHWTATACD